MKKEFDKSHGSPYDRGSADRYYGRGYQPNKWIFGELIINGINEKTYVTVPLTDPEEIAAYEAGWDEEDDRKNWS